MIYVIIICLLVLILAFSFRANYSLPQVKSESVTVDVPIIYGAGFCKYCTDQ